MGSSTDEQLAKRASAGEQTAFGELVDRYSLRLVRYLILTSHFPLHVAEDVAQETWVRAWRAVKNRQPGPFRGWLFQIANHVGADTRRSAHSRRMHTDGEAGIIPLRAANGAQPIDELIGHETAKRLATCLGRLSHDFRFAFEAFADGTPDEDLAAQLKLSEVTVRTRRFKARTILKQCLEGGGQ